MNTILKSFLTLFLSYSFSFAIGMSGEQNFVEIDEDEVLKQEIFEECDLLYQRIKNAVAVTTIAIERSDDARLAAGIVKNIRGIKKSSREFLQNLKNEVVAKNIELKSDRMALELLLYFLRVSSYVIMGSLGDLIEWSNGTKDLPSSFKHWSAPVCGSGAYPYPFEKGIRCLPPRY